ncbi:hypothetical protein [Candidatus Amarolinea dominans]|uniref:hypothetical protein n=1 Tax=Candidatus Amarolinea dominans TaxID=3140696 RepID=UPI001D7198FD|nr:right-handed parallel beta-helix repeat-containing protein [Anaerolineae bacterium]
MDSPSSTVIAPRRRHQQHYSGSPTIQNNTFAPTGSSGGGITTPSGSPTIQNNTFSSNSASSGSGGGSTSAPAAQPSRTIPSAPTRHPTDGHGDPQRLRQRPTIQNNTFSANSAILPAASTTTRQADHPEQHPSANSASSGAYGSGGGISAPGRPTIQNNTSSANSASGAGSGIYNYSNSPTIQNNTFSANSASPGGIYNYSDSPTIQEQHLPAPTRHPLRRRIFNYSGTRPSRTTPSAATRPPSAAASTTTPAARPSAATSWRTIQAQASAETVAR